ncbi:PREDICTED: inactive tyrosine-protein kinase 7-like [Acropora digitifera]|uniref:inactive tyrosine-protein kinase 7-like n=1 Tax=Acropora digitifera TaxID=70779 RepID=UPI00077A9E5C|nr:PREDICTED: inactive tyrosine-protein kinase 7-like [Acropora digitifera]
MAVKGSQVNIPCHAIGSPEPVIEWFVGDGRRPVQSNAKYHIAGNGTLQIKNIVEEDATTYKCTAENLVGKIERDTSVELAFPVRVKLKAMNVEVRTLSGEIMKSGQWSVLCNKPKGNPEPNITWTREGGEKLPWEGFYVKGCCTLVNDKTDRIGSSKFTCTATNSFESSQKTVEVIVSEVPQITTKPKNQSIEEGKTVTLACSATAVPPASISWTKDRNPLAIAENSNFNLHKNGTLTITQAKTTDSGDYRCSVDHPGGWTDSATAKVVVMGAVKIRSIHYHTVNADLHTSQRIECNFEGYPPITVSWKKNDGEELPQRIKHKNNILQFQRIEKKDQGRYWCTGKNGFSMARNYVNISVYGEDPFCGTFTQHLLSLVVFTVNANGDIEHGDAPAMAMNPVYRSQPSYDSMEFPRHDLETIRSLGNGVYGRASLARASGIRDGEKETMVIVKSLSSGDDQVREEFNKEMEALVGLHHENVVGLLGVCKEVEPVLMIFESLEKGDLKQFLLSCHDNGRSKFNSNQKLAICGQVAAGMEYLSLLKLTHKDLAARNIMVGKDLQVKIGFLSLSYDLYSAEYYRFNNLQIPLRWMSPEAIFHDEFSEKSDVWSFGVLMWEIYTFGQMPYHDRSNEEVLKGIRDDLRLAKPENCPKIVLEVLGKCWEANPLNRPSFAEMVGDLNGIKVDSHV